MAQEGLTEGARLQAFSIQDTGGTAKTVARGVQLIKGMLKEANRVKRQPVPASHITVGLQCGGSDGYSGISANPALGAAVDRLVRHGGSAILSETPEIYGGEHLLTRRAVSREVADKLLARIRWWEAYTRAQQHVDGQQSVGRQQGRRAHDHPRKVARRDRQERHHQPGRRGRVRRGRQGQRPRLHGHAGLRPGVGHRPGGRRRQPDLLHHRPRFGVRLRAEPVAEAVDQHRAVVKQQEDIDIDCGGIIDGSDTIDTVGERIFRLMLTTASGEKTKSELHGYGQNEFVPWQLGAVM